MNVIIERFKSSSPTLKTAILAVAAIWLIAVGTIVSSLFILWQKPIAAEPPPFDQVNPAIRLDPTTGAANTPLTVNGEGWQPGDLVTIYLAAPGQPDTSGYILGSTMVDEQGQFTISTTLPAGNEWQGVDRVIARTTTGEMSAQAFLQFAGTGETATPTATATNTVETTSTTATATGVVQTATATPTSQPGVPLVVTATDLNVRSGPGTNYSVLGLLKAGQSAEITGVSPDRQWWQIRFGGAADGRGWLAARYVTAQNTANVPVVQPPPAPVTPTPTPTTVVITDWRGEYYSNASLNGSPVLVRNDSAVNFDWGGGSPAGSVPVDNFSARWTRNQAFSGGTYRFTLRADDGVRFWIDNTLIVDEWHDSSGPTYTKDVFVSDGSHALKVEYYERGYSALVQLNWSRVDSYPDWKGEYYNNRKLEGSPVIVRNDNSINFDWGQNAPVSGVGADNFSVRWTRKLNFDKATYRFTMTIDDGARLWIDDSLVIDSWQDGEVRTIEVDKKLDAGDHRIRVEYFERSGAAIIKLKWQKVSDNQAPVARPGGPYTVEEAAQITFDGRASSDPDGSIVKYEWDFNYNGSNFDVEGTGATATTRYGDGPAAVQAALRVTDDKGATSIATVPVTVQNVAPAVEAGGPYSGQVNNNITLSGSATDPSSIDQSGLTYRWEFGDGTTANGPIVGHSYAQPGSYTARLTVTDKDGGVNSDTATVTVSKSNQPPDALIDGPAQGKVDQALTFRGSGSTDHDGTIVTYSWNFGDGSTATGSEVNHAYKAAGDYQVALTVTDNEGATDSATVTVHIDEVIVINLPPTIILNAPSSGQVGEGLTFDASQSFDPEGTALSWAWNFGDGTTTTGEVVTHSYTQAGQFTLTLVVTDATGQNDQSVVTLTISE